MLEGSVVLISVAGFVVVISAIVQGGDLFLEL